MKKNRITKKLISILLAAVLSLSVLTIAPFSVDAATNHTQAEAVAWAQSQIGKTLDYDGANGVQCVDSTAYYYAYLGATPSGNACEYTWNALPSGWQRFNYYTGFTPQFVILKLVMSMVMAQFQFQM